MISSLDMFLDPLLIPPFQAALALGLGPFWAFLCGVLVVALLATVVGELCMAAAYYLNRRHFARVNKEMVLNNNLSIQAIAQKDKQAFKACNHLANEAFGLSFFSGITLFASSIWPAFFILGWLSFRFSDAQIILPGLGYDVPPNGVFIPCYILVRVAFAKLAKPRLWPFTRIEAWRKKNEDCGEELLGWDSLTKPRA